MKKKKASGLFMFGTVFYYHGDRGPKIFLIAKPIFPNIGGAVKVGIAYTFSKMTNNSINAMIMARINATSFTVQFSLSHVNNPSTFILNGFLVLLAILEYLFHF
jgi:hypothetical protein